MTNTVQLIGNIHVEEGCTQVMVFCVLTPYRVVV